MTDDNKTALTHRVTAAAAIYLDGLGVKPVESEVEIRPGWIADLAGYWYATLTESKRLGLADKACEMLGIELRYREEAIPRVYGSHLFTVLVEVKASRSDFTRDTRKWLSEPPANICFLAYPTGLLEETELPTGWHGLEMTKDGGRLRKVHRRNGRVFAQHSGLALDFVAAVGIRRDHRTRYAATRAMVKAWRTADGERRRNGNAGSLVRTIAQWITGERRLKETLREELDLFCGVRKMPEYCDRHLATLESLKKDMP
jgi:hypothetical protein